jgi:hypothetical protein
LERRPWSARDRCKRLPPRVLSAPVTADVREVAEEGNAVGLRDLSVGTGRRHGTPSHANRDASFARSSNPCSSILTMHRRGNSAVVGRSRRHRGQANSGNREELAPGSSKADASAARHVSLLSDERRDAEEKEGGRGHRPCEERESRFGCSHVVSSCRSRQAASGLE